VGVFLRLVKYSFRYRGRFLAGLGVAFLVAVLSAVSLNSFLPFFEALGDKSAEFALPSSRAERNLMKKAILASLKDKPLHVLILIEALKYPSEDKAWTDFLGLTQPRGKEGKLDKVKSRILLALLPDKPTGVTDIESFQLRQIIYWKLRVNAYGFRPLEVIYGVLMILVPLIALRLVLQIVTVRLIAKAGYRAVRDLRSDLYRKVQELPLTFFYSQKSGVILSRMINDAEVVAAVISSNLRDAITNIFILVTHFGVLCTTKSIAD
jgi:ATP-binding cassette subfamily B protein/subfamily B ATP-binding cassette protein MsbA